MATHKKSILTRFYIVAGFMTLFLLAIIFRVVNIQYAQGAKYKKLATELTIKQDTIKANKGNVYAADGNLLATSMSKYTIRCRHITKIHKLGYGIFVYQLFKLWMNMKCFKFR